MEVRTRSVEGRRFWRASGGHLATIAVALQLLFFGNGFRSKPRGKTSRRNPELEFLRQFVVVLNLILATPATSLVPNCNGPAVPLDPSPTWRGRRACCMGNSTSCLALWGQCWHWLARRGHTKTCYSCSSPT